MSKGTYLEDELLDWLRGVAFAAPPADLWWSLHVADPGEDGANEHGDTAGYDRTAGDLGAGNPASNATDIEWPEATANYSAALTHFGVWDAQDAGNFLGGGVLDAPKTIETGDIPRAPAGALTWTET